MDDFYRENVLDHYKNPRNFGKLSDSDYSAEMDNPLCGDRIEMEIKLKVQSGRPLGKFKVIKEIRFYGEGCAISTASASMLTERVKGMEIDEVQKLNKEDILKLLGIQLTPTRLKCALLPLEVLHKTLALAKDNNFGL